MCDKCVELQTLYSETADRLLTAQKELACFGMRGDGEFERLWRDSEAALRMLWTLREQIAAHYSSHSETCESAQGA